MGAKETKRRAVEKDTPMLPLPSFELEFLQR